MMEAFAYFPAIVYRDEQPGLSNGVLAASLNHLDKTRQAESSICQSDNLLGDPVFHDVSKHILECSIEILRDQGYDCDKYEFFLSGLWAQELKKGAGTNTHVHGNTQVSGWMFLETPVGGSYPIYYDTRLNKNMIELDFTQAEVITNATNMIHFNNVKPGTLLFANSWMQHQLTANNASDPTRCLHFMVSHKELLCNTF